MLVPGVGGKYSKFQVTGMIVAIFGIQTFFNSGIVLGKKI